MREDIRGEVGTTRTIIDNLTSGRTAVADRVEESPVLTAMLDAIASGIDNRRSMSECMGAAIIAAAEAQITMLRAGHVNPEGGEGAEPPVTDLLPMLEATGSASRREAADPGMPASPISADAMRALMAIELYASGNPQLARRDSLAALAEQDRARDARAVPIRPGAMSADELILLVERLTERLAA